MISQIPEFADIAALNKAAGDALRLQILRVLAQDAYGVLELCQIFEYRQSGMSHHLKVLADVGLVAKRREGNSIFYSRELPIGNSPWALMKKQLLIAVDSIELSPKVADGIAAVRAERASQSQVFFQQNAGQFKEQQDLIADFSTYGEAVTQLLRKVTVPSHNKAIEVGPGQGEFLPVLAGSYENVIALDNAPKLLEQARAHCQQQGVTNVDFVCNDTGYLTRSFPTDCLVMNMVLHHTPSPAEIFQDIAQCLKPGGVAIVTELCRHDQDWAKSSCGDLWLGFDPNELQHWAELVGMEPGHSHYFALRNGFQVQLQQFVRCT